MNWKNIKEYGGAYQVSSCGSIRKLCGKEVCQWQNDQGYMLVRLSRPRKTFRVHRLVAEAFIDNDDGLPFVNHIDFVRHNNVSSNLEWCTQWQNLDHSRKSGRMQNDYWKGKRSPNAKLSDEQVSDIITEYAAGGISWEAIGKKYSVSKRTIGRIVNGQSYKKM